MPSDYCRFKRNKRLANYRNQEFQARYEYEQKFKKAGKNSTNRPSKDEKNVFNSGRKIEPKTMKISIPEKPIEEYRVLDLNGYGSESEDEPKEVSGYEKWKKDNLANVNPENNSIDSLKRENLELKKSIQAAEKKHKQELENRDKYQQELEKQISHWKQAFENKKADQREQQPYMELCERLIKLSGSQDTQLRYIHEDAKKLFGRKRFREILEVGEKSLEASSSKRVRLADLTKFANRKAKDIPIYDENLMEPRVLESRTRIGSDGLYPDKPLL